MSEPENLPKGQTVLSRDGRAIVAIEWPSGEHIRTGYAGVTAIEAYDECGSMACVPWLAVFKGTDIALRTPADHVAICYKEPQP